MNQLILALSLLFAPHVAQPPSETHDVVVIVLDDVGWPERSTLSVLDYVAESGVTFSNFYAWPVCSPTRYAALTGQYPRRAAIGDVISAHNSSAGASPAPDRLDVMLPEALKPGYTTALIGKWHLGRASVGNRIDLLDVTESGPFVSGFDYWLAGNPNSVAQGPGSTGYFDWYRVDNHAVSQSHTTYATFAQTSEFQTWWDETPGDRFAWLAFNAAHAPFDLPPGGTDQPTARGDYLEVVHYLNGALDSALSVIDLETTYIVVLCDNGTPNDVAPYPAGCWKGTTFQGGVNVPLLIAGPGIDEDVISDRLVSAVDVPVTILELLGVTSRGFVDGVSFADELGSWTGDTEREWLFSERYDVPGGVQPEGYDDLAIVEGPTTWPGAPNVTVRLKRRIVDADGVGAGAVEDLIYDLVSDPYELAPGQFSAAHATVRARFDGYLASLPARQ